MYIVNKKPKGFVKKHIAVTGGDIRIKNGPTYLHYQLYDLIALNVNTSYYDKNKAIRIFGSIENWKLWRDKEIEIIKKQQEKEKIRRENAGEDAYKLPSFSRFSEPSSSYEIGEDGIARQRKE
jgi:hypothetical protein